MASVTLDPKTAANTGRRMLRGDTYSPSPLASSVPFYLLLFFLVTSFLQLGVRWPWLGVMRPTILQIALLVILAVLNSQGLSGRLSTPPAKWLAYFIAYLIFSIPFVTWPGSVINNLELLVQVLVYFYFTALFVDSEKRLKIFVFVFLACQTFRILEPLYLHYTEGYWGGKTYLGDGVYMPRLSGAPSDIINPNGLAFLCVSLLPFLFFWYIEHGGFWRLLATAGLGAAAVDAMLLTSSRSGIAGIALAIVAASFFVRRRLLYFGCVAVLMIASTVAGMNANQIGRVVGVFTGEGAGGATAAGRIDGIISDLNIWIQAPIFGHGLGTSLEANTNIGGSYFVSHNLYSEALVTLGILGFFLFMAFLKSVWDSAVKLVKQTFSENRDPQSAVVGIKSWLPKALVVWIAMCGFFSFASYGVTEYHWYMFAGLASALTRVVYYIESKPTAIRSGANERAAT